MRAPRPRCAAARAASACPSDTTSSVSGGKSAEIESRSPGVASSLTWPSTGSTSARSTSRVERCDESSKWRRSTISSPQNSRRTGSAMPKRVDVEDAAAQAELRDVLDHRHALEADALEMLGELARAADVALAQLDAQIGERARQARALEQRARRGEQHADLAATRAARASRRARPRPRRAAPPRRTLRAADRARPASRRAACGDRRASARRAATPSATTTKKRVGQTARERGDERRVGRTGQVRRRASSARGAGSVLTRRVNAGRRSIASSSARQGH